MMRADDFALKQDRPFGQDPSQLKSINQTTRQYRAVVAQYTATKLKITRLQRKRLMDYVT